MRAKTCGMSAEEKKFRRLNYCGTCKTTGALYSQKSRLLLNHDTVFLAEILTNLSGENVENRQNSYQSFNCLNLPEKEIPLSLEFAATANVILTEFKLADHVEDSNKKRFHLARKVFKQDFEKASEKLNGWNFPLEKVKKLLSGQKNLEAEILKSTKNPAEILRDLAEPTAITTAAFFAEGVKLIGKSEIEKLLWEIGFAFGRLIYLLDAFEDCEKDFKQNQFNAFRAAFDLKQAKISAETKRKITAILRESESEIIAKIYELPIAENQKSLFASRLSQNLQKKLRTNLPVLKQSKICRPKRKISFAEKWQNAKENARNLAHQYRWQMPLVFAFIFIFALVAPAQTKDAKSARECFDLSFNLMFLGAIFGSVLAFPKTTLMQNNIAEKEEKRRRWCDWCESCDCDCCDCCDCDCCNCDSCDCCCCDSCSCD